MFEFDSAVVAVFFISLLCCHEVDMIVAVSAESPPKSDPKN